MGRELSNTEGPAGGALYLAGNLLRVASTPGFIAAAAGAAPNCGAKIRGCGWGPFGGVRSRLGAVAGPISNSRSHYNNALARGCIRGWPAGQR